MKEIPILFSTEMVQALLAGRKTMTRRIVKMYATSDNHPNRQNATWLKENKTCPYGQPGDILWVRENFCYVMLDHAHDLLEGANERTQFVYKASVHPDWMDYAKEKYGYKWKPSIHMPKGGCRLFLKVKSVRVERLKDIDQKDAIAEGIKVIEHDEAYYDYMKEGGSYAGPVGSFYSLWRSINGEESFNSNPWVWVIEFERVAKK